MKEHFLWTEKYRPRTIEQAILPDSLKATFRKFVKQKNIPNLLLTGTAGVGKTTIARAMLEELDCDYMVINGSLEGRQIDTLRNEIANFASSMSLSGGRKYVILDEADYLGRDVQPALRNFMEEYSSNCGFILTCNFKSKIILPLQSRCSIIDFKLSKDDRVKVAGMFLKRIQYILDQENVEYDIKVVAEVLKKHFPDWRRVINELQRYSANGKIDTGILSYLSDVTYEQLFKFMKEKNFTGVRKWVAENSDIPMDELVLKVYTSLSEKMTTQSIAECVMILADYQYKSAFVVNQEINMAACFATIMASCTFK